VGRLILINDVNTETEENGLIVGNSLTKASVQGEKQAVKIAKFLSDRMGRVTSIASTDALRVSRLVHQIQARCNIMSKVLYHHNLQERNFGVLTGTRFSINSDIFTHTRICAENGETIRQCQDRALSIIKKICNNDGAHVLTISHPFLCQIITNSLYGQSLTLLTDFWFKKGSVIENKFHPGNFGLEWKRDQIKAYNLLEQKDYTFDEIYESQINTEYLDD